MVDFSKEKCINSNQVEEADYFAYINGEASPRFQDHVSSCKYCQNEIRADSKLDNLLHNQLNFRVIPERFDCPTSQQLGEYLIDLLDGFEYRKIASHLKSCRFCQPELESLQTWLPEPELNCPFTNPSTPLAQFTTSQALHSGQNELGFGWVKKLVATLINPGSGSNNFALSGVRGSSNYETKVFQADDIQLTVQVVSAGPRSSNLKVEGLVQGANTSAEDLEGSTVRLLSGTELVETTEIDDIGNFIFENVPPATGFDLEISLHGKLIHIPDIGFRRL